MGYPVAGEEGRIASWGSANFYSVLLAAMTTHTYRLNYQQHPNEVTGVGVANEANIAGLYEWGVTVSAYGFATPRMGNVGTVALASPSLAILHVESFDWTVEALEHEITEFAGSPASGPIAMAWRPGGPVKVSGSLNCRVDSATAMLIENQIGDTTSTATLLYGDEATDDQVSGKALLTVNDVEVAKGRLSTVKYQFVGDGAWTPAGTSSPLGSSALGVPLWSQGGAAVGAILLEPLTSHVKLTGQDSFWKKITLSCAVGKPVELTVDVRGTGTLTPSYV